MRRSVLSLLNEAKQKMSGYVALFTYRLMNLCIKAEPASLLSIEIKDGDSSIGLDVVSDVGQVDDFQFIIIPKIRSVVNEIVKAIVSVHPEFIYEIKKVDEPTNEEDEEAEVVLYITMPEVNEERRDLLNDTVEVLYNDCNLKCNAVYDKCLVEVGAKLIMASDSERNEGKEQLERLHTTIKELMDDYKERKLNEIEEGYERYLKKKEEKELKQKSEEKAHNKNAGMSMKLFGEDDDE